MIKITLPDGSVREYEKNIKIMDIAKSISEGLARVVVGAKVNGKLMGLNEEISEDSTVELLKFDDEAGKEIFWHTSAHMLAQAIKRKFPEAKFAIGPAIKDGFYYDIDLDHRLTSEDLIEIEKEMKKIAKEDFELVKSIMPRDEALKYLRDKGEIYKVELVEDLPEDTEISFYTEGEFCDLCRGPHLPSTKKVKAIKLMSIAGAYWRGDEKRQMLQRVYGISFEKQKDLDAYLDMLEEAKKRDHRKLGKELDLFTLHTEGPGFPFFHPKGMVLWNCIQDFWREEHNKRGYGEIKTPLILNEALWHQSGHWDHYKENMYFTRIDDGDYAIKPMNCPGSMIIYKSNMYSYRDLPLRWAELGQVHRHELAGSLHGLMRVRTFTQDDAHIFMLPEQVKDELMGVIDLADEIYKAFGFKYHVELSTRPEDFMGEIEDWDIATDNLRMALEEKGIEYRINEGDGAFYGPKIDYHLEDSIGRTWQCATIQLDFQMPERFDLTYTGKDNEKHRPVMIHRAILGSMERFIGILIEHFAGKFPAWLAPVQVSILPISDKFNDYAEDIKKKYEEMGIRVEIDTRTEKIGYKIREAQMSKVPYMLIIGEREMENKEVGVRDREEGDIGAMKIDDFAKKILKEIETKEIKEEKKK
ncbi:MAG: threonine--tRNA ligase [Andreesenia angusta]|nr:threonine--tRNA ligase [Andreesenia angusta]